MKLNKLIFLSLLVFMFATAITNATPQWYNYGNDGATYSGNINGWLWASAFPSSSDELTETQSSINFDYPPIVDGLLSAIGTENYIYATRDSEIFIYSNTFSLVDSLGYDGNIQSELIRFSYSDGITAFPHQAVGLFTPTTFYATTMDESGFYNLFNWSIASENIGIGFVDMQFIENQGTQYVSFVNASDMVLYELDGTLIGVFDGNASFGDDWTNEDTDTSYDNYGNLLTTGDINGDNHEEIYWIQTFITPTPTRIGITIWQYDFKEGEWNDVYFFTDAGVGIVAKTAMISFINIGTPTSDPEILFSFKHTTLPSASTCFGLNSGLGLIAAYSCLGKPPIVVDYDLDGNNEVCANNVANYLLCFDETGALEKQISLNFTQQYDFFSMGKYDQAHGFMDIVTAEGIYEINSDNSTSKFIDLDTTPSANAITYPVSLENRVTFVKDVVVTDKNVQRTYIDLTVPQTVCGNGICELGETVLTCFEDCVETTVPTAFISSVQINPSPVSTWQQNTTVQIYVCVDSNVSTSIVQSRVSLYEGEASEQNSSWSLGFQAPRCFTHNFIAYNLTNESLIKIEGRILNSSFIDVVQYNFSVAGVGIGFGDLVFSEDFEAPDEVVITVPTDTESTDDNALREFVSWVQEWSGLAGNLIWLGIMFLFGSWMFYHAARRKSDYKTTVGGIAVLEVILLIMGWKLEFIDTGIIIVISVLAIGVGVLKIKNAITPSGAQ